MKMGHDEFCRRMDEIDRQVAAGTIKREHRFPEKFVGDDDEDGLPEHLRDSDDPPKAKPATK